MPNAEFIFVRDENDVDRELTKLTSELANDALYYVSSSEKIVESVSQSLQDKESMQKTLSTISYTDTKII